MLTTEASGAGLVRHEPLILWTKFTGQSRTGWKKSLKLHAVPASFAELRDCGATMNKVCNFCGALTASRNEARVNQLFAARLSLGLSIRRVSRR
jgi:hypothetical protein